MGLTTWASMSTEESMVGVSSIGPTEQSIMVRFRTISLMAMESICGLMEESFMGSGSTTRWRVRVTLDGRMAGPSWEPIRTT